jgi:uncharacterized protein
MKPANKVNRVNHMIRSLESVVIGLSGGVDSTLIAKLCLDNLGPEKVWLVTGESASIAPEEIEYCRQIADWLKIPEAHFISIRTEELEDPEYAANPENRCYFCKQELFGRLQEIAQEVGAKHVVDGANASDLQDYRPGLKAGRELRVRSPLAEAGITKQEIRALAKKLGLPNWDKPAMPCLSSRIPYHSPVTSEKLDQIARAERFLGNLGFRQFRVRHHGQIARLELDNFDLLSKNGVKEQINQELKKIGFTYVVVDLEGFRSGSLNETLSNPAPISRRLRPKSGYRQPNPKRP